MIEAVSAKIVLNKSEDVEVHFQSDDYGQDVAVFFHKNGRFLQTILFEELWDMYNIQLNCGIELDEDDIEMMRSCMEKW